MTSDPAMTAKQRREAHMIAHLESISSGLDFVIATLHHMNADAEDWKRHMDRKQQIHELKDTWENAKARAQALQRQGSPEASREPERSRAIAGSSTPASSSGSIM
jgi:hypothetical protein